jgi:hypothetical protein
MAGLIQRIAMRSSCRAVRHALTRESEPILGHQVIMRDVEFGQDGKDLGPVPVCLVAARVCSGSSTHSTALSISRIRPSWMRDRRPDRRSGHQPAGIPEERGRARADLSEEPPRDPLLPGRKRPVSPANRRSTLRFSHKPSYVSLTAWQPCLSSCAWQTLRTPASPAQPSRAPGVSSNRSSVSSCSAARAVSYIGPQREHTRQGRPGMRGGRHVHSSRGERCSSIATSSEPAQLAGVDPASLTRLASRQSHALTVRGSAPAQHAIGNWREPTRKTGNSQSPEPEFTGLFKIRISGMACGYYRTSSPVTALPMIMRWISDVPSKIVKMSAFGAGRGLLP